MASPIPIGEARKRALELRRQRDGGGGNGPGGGGGEIMDDLIRDKGQVLPILNNAIVLLARDADLAGLCAHDQFADQLLITRAPPLAHARDVAAAGPYPRAWTAEDVALIQAHLQRRWSPRFTRAEVEAAMPVDARRNGFHPVKDYLAALEWDGRPRLDSWLIPAFGCPANAFHAAAGAKMLIAAVRRIRRPGCKWDHTPVLEGGQGIGKSSALRELFGEAWFSDAMPEDLAGKDAAMALNGVWCLELAELQQVIRSDPATVKAYLTRQVDRYRPPYGRVYVERPRASVLFGTTNSEEWLSDATGNRRFWPLSCSHADRDWIAANRTQLWAEAAAREAAGEAHWLDGAEAREGATIAQESRLVTDAWADKIEALLRDGRTRTTSAELMDSISLPTFQQNKAAQMRVADILKAAGWSRDRTARSRYWLKPSDDGGIYDPGGGHDDNPPF